MQLKPPANPRVNRKSGLSNGLTAFYLLNNGNGRVYNAITGAMTGEAAPGVTWKHSAMGLVPDFDGATGTYITMPADRNMLVPQTNMATLVARVLPRTRAVPGTIVNTAHSAANYAGMILQVDAVPGIFRLQYGDNTGATVNDRRSKTSVASVVADKWVTLGGSIRGAVDMSVYIDGVEDAGTHSGAGGALSNGSGLGAHIARQGAGSNSWLGQIAWIGIWKRALTSAEHMRLHINPFSILYMPEKISEPLIYSVYFDLQPSGVTTGPTEDTATVYLDIDVEIVEEEHTSGDTATIYLELATGQVITDENTVLLRLTASGIDVFVPPCLIIGEGESELKWRASVNTLRWNVPDVSLRFFATLRHGSAQC